MLLFHASTRLFPTLDFYFTHLQLITLNLSLSIKARLTLNHDVYLANTAASARSLAHDL